MKGSTITDTTSKCLLKITGHTIFLTRRDAETDFNHNTKLKALKNESIRLYSFPWSVFPNYIHASTILREIDLVFACLAICLQSGDKFLNW